MASINGRKLVNLKKSPVPLTQGTKLNSSTPKAVVPNHGVPGMALKASQAKVVCKAKSKWELRAIYGKSKLLMVLMPAFREMG
jgi:hypothetical protein